MMLSAPRRTNMFSLSGVSAAPGRTWPSTCNMASDEGVAIPIPAFAAVTNAVDVL